MTLRLLVVLATGTAFFAGGCSPRHVKSNTPRTRKYDPGEYETAPEPVSDGSLWQDSSRSLFADFRAGRVGDLVTIRIDENPQGMGDATTEMTRDSSMTMGVENFFGLTQALQQAYPDINPEQLLGLMSQSGFRGDGKTRRGSRLRGDVAVRVKKLLPNSDLFIEGTKVILVNDEELHIYVSGVIRPEDIEPDNAVPSNKIADAQIEFTGRGELTTNQRKGWLTRLLSLINPI